MLGVSATELIEKIFHIQIVDYFKIKALGSFLGYLLNKVNISKKFRMRLYLIGIFNLIFMIIEMYILTTKDDGLLDTYLYGYLNPTVIIVAISIFILFKYIDWNKLLSN